MEINNQRYSRHNSLKGFGAQGQQKLTDAKVLVIGAGGLGCPVLQYLAAAGVGTLGIADDDLVALSNLQRQVLYNTKDIGKEKAAVAELKLQQLNPEIVVNSYKMLVNNKNILDLIDGYDVVVDCTDNFTARYLINDACVLMRKPLVFGAIYQYEGQVAVFNVADQNNVKTNYRHLFAIPPDPLEVPDCNEAGVLGVLPGIIGTMQATEVIKVLTGIGEVLINKLLNFSLLTYEIFIAEIPFEESVVKYLPESKIAFEALDYNWLCSTSALGVTEFDPAEFFEKINNTATIIIDVRESNEQPQAQFLNFNVPLSTFDKSLPEIEEQSIILFCQSGKRSLKAARLLLEKYGTTKMISHLKGGMNALQEYQTHE